MHKPAPLFIGIMSGTSADGMDVAIVRCSEQVELLHCTEHPMPEHLRTLILQLAEPGCQSDAQSGSDNIDHIGALGQMLGVAYADAVLHTLHSAALNPGHIAAIGCHGQTIRHRPRSEHAFTLQIGSAATIAEQTGITTVSDFRSRDIAAGGEGAPLVPFAHQRLFASASADTAVLNIGGIANITWLAAGGHTTEHPVSGFDTGPGNMLMDALMQRISAGKQAYDADGQLAASGTLCEALLEQLMQHPFVQLTPPKSTGREAFGAAWVDRIMQWPDISHADRMATACHFTAQSIRQSIRFLPAAPARWLCCGGGTRNRYLMQLLQQQLAPATVTTTTAAGIAPQAVEAVCFALLAEQTLSGRSNTLSAVTGASHDVCGGSITPGDNWPALLQQLPTWTR